MLYDPYTAIPLSSGIPGITIESEPVTGNFSLVRYNVAVEKLTIGPEMYNFLQVLYIEFFYIYICSFITAGNI